VFPYRNTIRKVSWIRDIFIIVAMMLWYKHCIKRIPSFLLTQSDVNFSLYSKTQTFHYQTLRKTEDATLKCKFWKHLWQNYIVWQWILVISYALTRIQRTEKIIDSHVRDNSKFILLLTRSFSTHNGKTHNSAWYWVQWVTYCFVPHSYLHLCRCSVLQVADC
jgi:hypothetical protein